MDVDRTTELEQAVFNTFPSIAAWRPKTGQPLLPQPQSELGLDDQDWPYFPVSTVAFSGLASAVDHLDAIKQHVESQVLFPVAHLTLCRSALIGAAQAVWILGPPSRDTRVERNRTVLAYLYGKHLQYLNGLQDLSDTRHIGTDTVAAHIRQRAGELGLKRAADGQRSELDTTRMIKEAADFTFDEPRLTQEAVLCWRSSSGAAHGLPWPLLGTPGTVQTKLAGDDGIAEFEAGGSLARMANAYMAAFRLARKGWELLDLRAERHEG